MGASPEASGQQSPPVSRRLVLLLAVLLVLQLRTDQGPESSASPWAGTRGLRIVGQVHAYIRTHAHKPPSDEELYRAAVRAMLRTVDRHSEYLPPGVVRRTNQMLYDKAPGGIGVIVVPAPGQGIRIGYVLPQGAAAAAGLKVGDLIVSVDGADVSRLSPYGRASNLRGAVGTEVRVEVISGGKKRKVTLIRRSLPRRDLTASRLLAEDRQVGYIRLQLFSDGVGRRLKTEIEKLLTQGMRALIFDLRHNSGGTLDEGLAVADLFLRRGLVITTIEQRDQNRAGKWITTVKKAGPVLVGDFPLAILVDQFTASAAELAAAALQDHGRALIVGTRTFGKGRIQEIIPLGEQGGALRLTVARYLTPKGEDLEEEGLKPDLEVGLTKAELRELRQLWGLESLKIKMPVPKKTPDPQLERAVAEMRKRLAGSNK